MFVVTGIAAGGDEKQILSQMRSSEEKKKVSNRRQSQKTNIRRIFAAYASVGLLSFWKFRE